MGLVMKESHFLRWCTAAALAGLATSAAFFFLPGSPQGAWQFQFTGGRLLLASGLGLLWLLPAIAGVHLGLRTRWGKRLAAWLGGWLQDQEHNRQAWMAAGFALGTGLGFLILLAFTWSEITYFAWFIRLAPGMLWLVLTACFGLLVLWAGIPPAPAIRELVPERGLLILALLILAAGILIFFAQAGQAFSFTVDDAFITFRYAQNLADGWGPTFNQDPPRVEGYTTFLWMVLMALPHLAGIDVVLTAKLAGILLTTGTFVVLYASVLLLAGERRGALGHIFAAISVFFLGCFTATAIHAVAGMETALFTFLFSLLVYVCLLGILRQAWVARLAPWVGLLLGLTRPEGNLVALVMLGGLFLFAGQPVRRALIWTGLGLYILPGALYFGWRYSYYGLLFPIPFYLKAIQPGGSFPGAGTVLDYLRHALPPLALFLAIAAVRFNRALGVMLSAAAALLLFYLIPVHMMGFNWRFVYPTAPVLMALGGYGGYQLARLWAALLREKEFPQASRMLVACLVGACLLGAGYLTTAPATLAEVRVMAQGLHGAHVRLGVLLQEYPAERPMVLAIGDAGAVPYYSRWETVDLIGLNDQQMAFATAPQVEYFLSMRPDLVVIGSRAADAFVRPDSWQARYYEASIASGMADLGALRFGREDYLWLVADPESELYGFLQARLGLRSDP